MIKDFLTQKYIKNDKIFNPKTKNNLYAILISSIFFIITSIIFEFFVIYIFIKIYEPKILFSLLIIFCILSLINYLCFIFDIAIIDNAIKYYKKRDDYNEQ